MSFFVEAVVVSVTLAAPLPPIPWMEPHYRRIPVEGIACASPEDLMRIFEVSDTLPNTITRLELVEAGLRQNIICNHYDTTMLLVGPLPKPGNTIKSGNRTFQVYHMIFGTRGYHQDVYVAL